MSLAHLKDKSRVDLSSATPDEVSSLSYSPTPDEVSSLSYSPQDFRHGENRRDSTLRPVSKSNAQQPLRRSLRIAAKRKAQQPLRRSLRIAAKMAAALSTSP